MRGWPLPEATYQAALDAFGPEGLAAAERALGSDGRGSRTEPLQ